VVVFLILLLVNFVSNYSFVIITSNSDFMNEYINKYCQQLLTSLLTVLFL